MKKIFCFLFMALIMSSCFQVNCEKIIEEKRALHCNVIVTKVSGLGRELRIYGTDPVSKQRILFIDENVMYFEMRLKIERGDTLVKNKGELDMFIHKKDTVLVSHYKCFD